MEEIMDEIHALCVKYYSMVGGNGLKPAHNEKLYFDQLNKVREMIKPLFPVPQNVYFDRDGR